VAATVSPERAEIARGLMLELFPEGFEERDTVDGVELAAYTDGGGEERLWAAFGAVRSDDVPAGWEERWRAFHRPIQVGSLWVGPPWEVPPVDATAVVIDPGRAFGTGGHATTRLCLELLLEQKPSSLLDVGCGSGVLAVAAARLGFSPVVAIDSESAAVDATRRNAEVNGAAVDVRVGDALSEKLPAVAFAAANVSFAFAQRLAPRLDCSGLIVSGYAESEQPDLAGFRRVERRVADGWAADLLRREE
jgi:ribosomal protein L11 methyltransferase